MCSSAWSLPDIGRRLGQVEEFSILSLEERIAALYLFSALYRDQHISDNPFVSYLIEVCSSHPLQRYTSLAEVKFWVWYHNLYEDRFFSTGCL